MAEPQATGIPRRLLVVSQHYWPESFRINDIVQGLVAQGVQVDVLCGLPNYPKGEWFPGYRYGGPRRESNNGANIFRSGEIRRKGNTSLRIFLNYVSFPIFALFNLPRLNKRHYDAVFCYNTSPVVMMWPAIAAAKRHRAPLTTYVLDLWPDNLYSVLPIKSPFLRRVAKAASLWCYRRSPRLIALSGAQAGTLAARLAEKQKPGATPPKLCIIPQYCEDFYAEEVVDDSLAPHFAGRFTILFAGNLSPAQDLENLIAAMQLLRSRAQGQNIQVLILGDGMSREALEAQVNKAGLGDTIRFMGQVPPTDIPKWTHHTDALFAGLSKSENLGLTIPAKIASYLAAGRPMLAAMDGEGAKAAQASGAALLSPAGNTEALAANILALANMTDAQRGTMGQAGRACWRQHYSREKLLARMAHFIFDIPKEDT